MFLMQSGIKKKTTTDEGKTSCMITALRCECLSCCERGTVISLLINICQLYLYHLHIQTEISTTRYNQGHFIIKQSAYLCICVSPVPSETSIIMLHSKYRSEMPSITAISCWCQASCQVLPWHTGTLAAWRVDKTPR